MKNYYIAFDSLIKERNDVLKHMVEHQTEIVNHVKTAKCYELYSSSADDLGILTPSLIRDKITSGYHKGRRLKQKPLKKGYVSYEFDNTMRPLRIRKYNKEGHLDVTFYFIDYNDALFAIPCGGNNPLYIYPTDLHKIEYREGQIWRYSTITSNSLWQELYDFAKNDYVECKNCYYVSNLVGSDKSVLEEQNSSPLQTWLAKIYMIENKVSRLLYYNFSNNKEELIYEYGKKHTDNSYHS